MEKLCRDAGALWAGYEKEGEAAPLALHVRDCAVCRGRALREAPEMLFALLALPHEMPEAVPVEAAAHRIWGGGLKNLRHAAAVLMVLGLGWTAQWLWRQGAGVEPPALNAGTPAAHLSMEASYEELRSTYPLVRPASGDAGAAAPVYQGVLPDGTRIVFFDVQTL
jgi:hypothetical protein